MKYKTEVYSKGICLFRLIKNKPQCRYGSTVYKCSISSQSIKYWYKFKSNQKKNSPKILELIPPRCVPSLKSLAQVLADICKCPSSSQTIKYRYKFKSNPKKFFPKMLVWIPSRRVPSLKSLSQVKVKKEQEEQ